MQSGTEKRKDDHIRISLEEKVQARDAETGFKDVYLVHQALPELDRQEVSTRTQAFGHEFSAPILVGAITGGTQQARKINGFIAEAVEELGLGMGVGSQRAALENSRLTSTYEIVRQKARSAFLIANIGAPQLAAGYGVKEAETVVKMIEADALAIHLNPLQEAIQPEGEAKYSGVFQKIAEITEAVQVPVIVKETGAGISAEVAKELERVGVQGVDVAGTGGTSWAAVEYYRAKSVGDPLRQRLGESFWDWGIPTVPSIVETSQSTRLTVIASGGVRTGVDVAKSLALGASLASMSAPILKPATKGTKQVRNSLVLLMEELKNTMFLVGAETVDSLSKTPVVLMGKTAEWLQRRGFKPERWARTR